jgi:hypothetical protein
VLCKAESQDEKERRATTQWHTLEILEETRLELVVLDESVFEECGGFKGFGEGFLRVEVGSAAFRLETTVKRPAFWRKKGRNCQPSS